MRRQGRVSRTERRQSRPSERWMGSNPTKQRTLRPLHLGDAHSNQARNRRMNARAEHTCIARLWPLSEWQRLRRTACSSVQAERNTNAVACMKMNAYMLQIQHRSRAVKDR